MTIQPLQITQLLHQKHTTQSNSNYLHNLLNKGRCKVAFIILQLTDLAIVVKDDRILCMQQ